MAKARNYRDLIVWQKAMQSVLVVYKATRTLPREELFSLTSQLRRAAISIPSNIAEGEGRSNRKEFVHFLRIAHGSLREVETQLLICHQLGYIQGQTIEAAFALSGEIGKILNGLIHSLRSRAA